MTTQTHLFREKPRYCIDTNVIISFMKQTDDEFYGKDVFKPQWEFLEAQIEKGIVIAPHQIELELQDWCKVIPELGSWLKANKHMFVGVEETEQLRSAKRILKQYEVYAKSKNFLGDLCVMTLADCLNITAISLESMTPGQTSKRLPKIPNVCNEFNIDHVSFAEYLRREKFGDKP